MCLSEAKRKCAAERRKVCRLIEKIGSAWGFEHYYCTAIFYEILGEICAECMQMQIPEHFKNAVDYIHQNFRGKMDIASICRKTAISATAFRQYFRIYYGITPTEYIRNLRLEYARNLLSGGMSVEQAAEACGIGDSKYFARLVKEKYGCSPRNLKLHGK